MKMLGDGAIGSRRRYLAEQAIFMEELFGQDELVGKRLTKQQEREIHRHVLGYGAATGALIGSGIAADRTPVEASIGRYGRNFVRGGAKGAVVGLGATEAITRSSRAYFKHKNKRVAKAAGFTTPITKPVASFKAPAAGGGASKPKVASLKPTGGALPSASQRLSALRQNLATTGPSSTPPAAAGAGTVGKSLRLRRRGRFQRQSTSSPVALLSREKMQGTPAEPLAVFTKALKIVGGTRGTRHTFIPMGGKHGGTRGIPQLHPDDLAEAKRQAATLKNSAGQPRWMVQHEVEEAGSKNAKARGGKEYRMSDKPTKPGPYDRAFLGAGVLGYRGSNTRLGRGYGISKREPLKTSISEDDARKLVDRHGLKGPLPKELNREQRMAAYEARYVSAGGKKAERWDHRAHMADKVKTGGLAIATAGGAGWLATRGRLKGKALSPRIRHHAETIAGAGATAGGAGELYAGHARRKRSSYASTPAGVAASALRRMQDYS